MWHPTVVSIYTPWRPPHAPAAPPPFDVKNRQECHVPRFIDYTVSGAPVYRVLASCHGVVVA